MGHPAAIGGLAVILSQAALHVGLDRSGLAEAFDLVPVRLRPEAVDTTQGVATIFPALTLTLIRLHQGDRPGAEAAYALAGPIRSWAPSPAMRMSAWGHALAVAIGLGRKEDIEFLASQFEPFRGQHAANGAGAGVYMGPVELHLGLAAAALGRLDAALPDLEAAVSICEANGACGYAVQASVELAAVVSVWQSRAHMERWQAEQLFPAFQAAGMAASVPANTESPSTRPASCTSAERVTGQDRVGCVFAASLVRAPGRGHNAGMAERLRPGGARAWSRRMAGWLAGVLVPMAAAG